MKTPIFTTLILVFASVSCNYLHMKSNLCSLDKGFAQSLEHTLLYRNRQGNLITYKTFYKGEMNEYSFQYKNNSLILKKSYVNYAFSSYTSSKELINLVSKLNQKLDKLSINSFNGEPDGLGILITLYMNNGDILFQTIDTNTISYQPLINEVSHSENLCDNWYLRR